MNSVLILTLICYLVISLVIWLMKPGFMFNNNGSLKNMGVNEDETIFYYPIVLIFIAIILYLIFYKLLSK